MCSGYKSRRGLYVRHTVVFQQLHVLFHPPVQRHAHLPGTGVDLRIIDSHFIEKRIRAGGCVTLGEVQCVSTKSLPGSKNAMPITPSQTGTSPPKMLALDSSTYTLQSD